MKKRLGQSLILILAATLLAALPLFNFGPAPLYAQTAPIGQQSWVWEPLKTRNINQPTGTVAANTDWSTIVPPGAAGSTAGSYPYADSTNFTRGSIAGTYVADTSVAFVPNWPRGPGYGSFFVSAGTDTDFVPYAMVRVRLVSSAITTVFDTVYVAMQGSTDGTNWYGFSTVPTIQHVADGTSVNGNLPALVGAEHATAENAAWVTIPNCKPVVITGALSMQQLCSFPGYVRLVLEGDYAGTYTIDIGHWTY